MASYYHINNQKLKPKATPLQKSLEEFKKSALADLDKSFKPIEKEFNSFLTSGLLNDSLVERIKSRPAFSFDCFDRILMHTRWTYITEYGYTLLSHTFIDALSDSLKGKKVLEVGAGSGFLASELQKKGIDITPIDKSELEDNYYKFRKEFTSVTKIDAETFLKEHGDKFDIIIMSWPSYSDSFANTVVKNLTPKHTLYYCGEGPGGCTADDDFFERVEQFFKRDDNESKKLNHSFISWPGIHDRWEVYNSKF